MMPVIFIGHGSPMNTIEDNEYTRSWKEIASLIPKPDAILSVSAHWVTSGTKVLTLENPETIHDFYGFPKEIYDIQYNAKGAPILAEKTIDLLGDFAIADNKWGLDHGTWSVLNNMYPKADIPTYQISIDNESTPEELFAIGEKLRPLRDENVLILGSGNIVHNLRLVDFSVNGGYEWAYEFDHFIKDNIIKKEYKHIINYGELGDVSKYCVPTTEHFNPLLYILGATKDTDTVKIFNNSCMAGSLSMTSYVFSD